MKSRRLKTNVPITICKDENGRPCKRNGLQKYRVRVSYTVYAADGSPTYKELERTAYGKLQAQELETKLLAQAADATKRSADAPETVGDLAEEYLRRLLASKTIRESSHEKKRSIQNNHILPTLRNAKISKLNAQVLMEWQDNMNAKEIGLAMKRNAYAELRALLNYAVKCEYLPANPLSKIDNFKDVNVSEHPGEAMQFYTFAQYRQFDDILAASTKPKDRALRVFFAVLFYTGARKGEAQALKWSDYDGETVWIRRSISQKIKGRRITETPPKNKSSYRKVSVPVPLKRILAEHKAFQQTDPAWSDDWRICGGPDVISDTTVDNACKSTAKAAGLPIIRIHDFRHSHASLLINANINIKAISARLGHARVEQTWNRYGHLYPEQDDRILDVLDKL